MKYVLIQMPDETIEIIDNHDNIGKGRVDRLCRMGGKPVGTIESDLTRGKLSSGISKYIHSQYNELRDRIRIAQKALDGGYPTNEEVN